MLHVNEHGRKTCLSNPISDSEEYSWFPCSIHTDTDTTAIQLLNCICNIPLAIYKPMKQMYRMSDFIKYIPHQNHQQKPSLQGSNCILQQTKSIFTMCHICAFPILPTTRKIPLGKHPYKEIF